jgi:drug/metabolite transporter (DMT)-like permease
MTVARLSSRWAVPAVLLGSVCLSFGPLMVRQAAVPPTVSAFWRAALAIVPLGIIAFLIVRAQPGWKRPAWRALAWAGAFFAADLIVWHMGILRTTLANAALLSNLSTPLLVVAGIYLHKRLPQRRTLVAVGIAMFGVLLLSFGKVTVSRETLLGDLLCFAAAIFYTGYLVVIARERATQPALVLLACVTPFVAAFILPVIVATDATALFPENAASLGWLLLLSLCSQVIGQGLIVFGFGRVSPVIAGLALLIQPVMAAVMGWKIYDEQLGLAQLIGAIAIIASLLLAREKAT